MAGCSTPRQTRERLGFIGEKKMYLRACVVRLKCYKTSSSLPPTPPAGVICLNVNMTRRTTRPAQACPFEWPTSRQMSAFSRPSSASVLLLVRAHACYQASALTHLRPGLQQAFTSAKPTKNIKRGVGGGGGGVTKEGTWSTCCNRSSIFGIFLDICSCLEAVQLYLQDLKQCFH